MTAISVSERLLEMAAFYTPLALTVTQFLAPAGQPDMTHETSMHCHLCRFAVRCSCMKLYGE